ncbi:MAG TPA: cytochrome c [Candidatus Limnocylindria bacterium]|nr:cytochrome c [Candidatus Limnocylindria bacterium]
MRRPLVALVVALAVIGTFTGGLAWLLSDPRPPAGAPAGQRFYYAFCAECHGVDGRGSWRAALFLLRPGDLTDPAVMRTHSDQYLFDIIKHGGSPFGRPGMPAFGAQISDADIEAMVRHIRTLGGDRLSSASRSTPP